LKRESVWRRIESLEAAAAEFEVFVEDMLRKAERLEA